MIQTKAIDILKTLSKKEFHHFGKFIDAASFTSNKKISTLYRFLKKYHPSFNSEKLSKENLYKSIYGNSPYNDIKMRKLLSDAYKEAEKFLVINGIFSDKDAYEKVLLKQLDRRKLDNLFIARYEKHGNELDRSKKNSDYFLEKFLLEWRNILFYMERGMQHKITENIYKRIEYLIFFFMSDLTLSLNDIEAHKISFNTEYNINLAKEFISNLNHKKLFKYIEKNDFENRDILYIYYLGYMASKNFGDENHYYTLKDFVLKNFAKFNEYSQRASLIPLINYCVRKVSANDEVKFKLDLYHYYKIYIKYRLYNISGKNYIRNDVLLNIFSNYFSLKKTAEAKKFVEDNIETIHPAHRKNMQAFAEAFGNFERGNFGESLKYISMLKSNTLLYKDMMKILTLKNHYELKNYEIAKEMANSYGYYLKDKTNITETRRRKRLKFLYYYNLLWKYYEGKKVSLTLKEMENKILKEDIFSEAAWVLEKVKELSSNNLQKN